MKKITIVIILMSLLITACGGTEPTVSVHCPNGLRVIGDGTLDAINIKAVLPNLKCVNLTEADLTGADLTGADLTGSDLTGSDLTGADLTGANLNCIGHEICN